MPGEIFPLPLPIGILLFAVGIFWLTGNSILNIPKALETGRIGIQTLIALWLVTMIAWMSIRISSERGMQVDEPPNIRATADYMVQHIVDLPSPMADMP